MSGLVDAPRWIARMAEGYRTLAMVILNSLILVVGLNFLLRYTFNFDPRPNIDAFYDGWVQRYGIEPLRRVYPSLSETAIRAEARRQPEIGAKFEPYIHMKTEPFVTESMAAHQAGFRLVGRHQGPWPIDKRAINIFVFGGSTTAGSGVSDDHAIPALIQDRLRQQYGRKDINVYNFATAGHYSTQQRIYFEQLITNGIVPDAAIFVIGLNDFAYWDDVPAGTDALRNAFSAIVGLLDPRGLGAAVGVAIERLPMTHLVRRIQATISAQAAEPISPNVQNGPLGNQDQHKIDRVIGRVYRFKAIVDSVAERFGIVPIVLFEPGPLYHYNLPLDDTVPATHLLHRAGYPAMRKALDQNDLGKTFIWCAEAMAVATRPLYLGAMHYNIEGNQAVAGCVAEAISERDLIAAALSKPEAPADTEGKDLLDRPLWAVRSSEHLTIEQAGEDEDAELYRIVAAGQKTEHYAVIAVPDLPPGKYSLSITAKPDSTGLLTVQLLDLSSSGALATFSIGTASVISSQNIAGGQLLDANLMPMSSGWAMLTLQVELPAAGAHIVLGLVNKAGQGVFRPRGEAVTIKSMRLEAIRRSTSATRK
jgi:lysophospholipase L1-like esterase